MTRRRLIKAFIVCLLATTAAAPVAFWLGRERQGLDLDYEASREPGAFVDMSDALWDCYQFGDFAGLRTLDRVRLCGSGFGPRLRYAALWRPTRDAMGGPLELATAKKIVQDAPHADEQHFDFALPGDPIDLALGPDPSGGHGGGGLGGPPPVLIGDLPPPPPEIPVPAGLPVFLTGLGGLLLVKRKKARG